MFLFGTFRGTSAEINFHSNYFTGLKINGICKEFEFNIKISRWRVELVVPERFDVVEYPETILANLLDLYKLEILPNLQKLIDTSRNVIFVSNHRNNMEYEFMLVPFSLIRNINTTSFNFSACDYSVTIPHLITIKESFKMLKVLELYGPGLRQGMGPGLNDEHVKIICETLLANRVITGLRLDYHNLITDVGAGYVAELVSKTNIDDLSMNVCAIKTKGCILLCRGILQNCTMKNCLFSGEVIETEALLALSHVIRYHPSLQKIYFKTGRIYDGLLAEHMMYSILSSRTIERFDFLYKDMHLFEKTCKKLGLDDYDVRFVPQDFCNYNSVQTASYLMRASTPSPYFVCSYSSSFFERYGDPSSSTDKLYKKVCALTVEDFPIQKCDLMSMPGLKVVRLMNCGIE